MNTKPKCPDCGAGVSLVYEGAVVIDTELEIVSNCGVTGGEPTEWFCLNCGGVERTDNVTDLGEDLVNWLTANYPQASEDLEAGLEWKLRR